MAKSYDRRVTRVVSDVESASSAATDLINDLCDEIDTLTNRIEELQAQIEDLESKREADNG